MKSRTAAEVMPTAPGTDTPGQAAKMARQVNGSTGIAPIVLSALVMSAPPTIAADLSKKLIEGCPAPQASQKTSLIPKTAPQSPIGFATKAFFAPSPASRLSV